MSSLGRRHPIRAALAAAAVVVAGALFVSLACAGAGARTGALGLRLGPAAAAYTTGYDFKLPMAVVNAYGFCAAACQKMQPFEGDDSPCVSESAFVDEQGNAWACDVAHCPRVAADDLRENQCGQTHWIELDHQCRLLRYRAGLDQPREGVQCSSDGSQLLVD